MARLSLSIWLLAAAFYTFYVSRAAAASGQEPLKLLDQKPYSQGEAIPVSCLNRSIESGEHIEDATGQLQYIPFPVCNETGKPLEFFFGIEREINCTIDFVSDPFFHLLEFYIHNDAPLTCRIPSRPIPEQLSSQLIASQDARKPVTDPAGMLGIQSSGYTHLVLAVTGTLQLSHLHMDTHLNVLLHAAPKSAAPGTILAGTAYSIPSANGPTRLVIGDSLPLRFSVRWYPSTTLPSGWTGVGGHLYASTLVYCLLSAGAATAICIAYFRGVELPRRLKRHGRERAFGVESGRFSAYAGGYGIGVGNGYGYGYGVGKKD